VTNTGNGSETFRLVMTSTIAGDQFVPTAATPSIYSTPMRGGDLSPGDTPYVVGSNDPVLSAEWLCHRARGHDIPAGVVDTNVGFTRLTGIRVPVPALPAPPLPARAWVVWTQWSGPRAPTARAEQQLRGVRRQPDRRQDAGSGRSIRRLPSGAGRAHQYSIAMNVTGSGHAANAVFTTNIPAIPLTYREL
jgi:hypothetical protein